MFTLRYFTRRFFALRYWAEQGADAEALNIPPGRTVALPIARRAVALPVAQRTVTL